MDEHARIQSKSNCVVVPSRMDVYYQTNLLLLVLRYFSAPVTHDYVADSHILTGFRGFAFYPLSYIHADNTVDSHCSYTAYHVYASLS